MVKIGVLGAGVIGLTTGIEVKSRFPNADVEILAENFLVDTTSDVAAGLFRPGTSFSGPDEIITKKWIRDAYEYYEKIQTSPEGLTAGVTLVSGYIFSSKSKSIVRNHLIEDVVHLYRMATHDELSLCPGHWEYGSFFTTMLTECRRYLPYMTEKFEKSGGKITKCKIDSFTELKKFDYVINCTGLGAKYLCNDHKLVPMRGQVVKVKAPFIKTFFYADYDTYIIPGFESVTLGGCRQFDSYNLDVDPYDSLAIRERCNALVPSLRSAKVVAERVGLRPHRDPVRVEYDVISGVRVVHNYGHGGYGVTTAPGTSKYAVDILFDRMRGNSKL